MSAATPRTISNAPDLRQLLVAVGALILAVALLVAVTISRQTSFEAAPAAAPATVNHDHGWSSSAAGSQDLVVRTADGGIVYMGIPYTPAADSEFVYTGYPSLGRELFVRTQNGGIRYMGIPYATPDAGPQGGANGTRFPQ